MAGRNGSGTYVRDYDFTADRDAGSPSNIISADKVDAEIDAIATALTASIAKDGQTTPTASLPMGGFFHTGVSTAAPVARSQYVPVSGLQDSLSVFADGGGTADAITAAISPAPAALVNGMRFRVRATGANTVTTPTFTPNSGTITAKTIVKRANVALAVGDIDGDGHELDLCYASDIDRWVLLNPAINFADSTTVRGIQSGNDNVMTVVIQRNAQTGTSYTVLATDRGKHVTFSNASPVAVTLPQATGSFSANYYCYVENIGAGLVTITPTTSTINGGSTLALQTGEAYLVTSDDTNYRALACGRSTVAETDFDAANDLLSAYDTSTSSRKSVTGQVLFNSVADIATDASPATGDFVLANDVSASNVAVKQTHASIQTLFAASQSQQEAGSSNAVNVTPGRQHFHKSAAKAWINFNGSGTPTERDSYGISSITDNGTGNYTLNFTTSFSAATYGFALSCGGGTSINSYLAHQASAAPTVSAFRMQTVDLSAPGVVDATWIGAVFYGDF